MILDIVERFRRALEAKGYVFFDSGDYDLNLIGVRHPNRNAGDYDDLFALIYKAENQWRVHLSPITTDPAKWFLRSPVNSKGAAILVPGQYRGCWRKGIHNGHHPALVQTGGKVRVYRDDTRDDRLDDRALAVDEGYFGINIHHARTANHMLKDPSSAGCQVFPYRSDHETLMACVDEQIKRGMDSFSYTLIEASDLA